MQKLRDPKSADPAPLGTARPPHLLPACLPFCPFPVCFFPSQPHYEVLEGEDFALGLGSQWAWLGAAAGAAAQACEVGGGRERGEGERESLLGRRVEGVRLCAPPC